MGPLSGVKVVELAGIGPGPFCCMLLADMGAEVIRVDRTANVGKDADTAKWNLLTRGRRNIAVDLKTPEGVETVLKLIEQADAVIEGFRPGVTERLGLGPDVCMKRNAKLVYGRMTGWGQTGPLAQSAGHDINYLAITGALAAIGGREGPAIPPLNLVGDFGGGSLYLAFGTMAALWERERSGLGQVVDAAIVDGVSSMMTFFAGLLPSGAISLERDRNLLAGAAPHYRCYTCADGRDIAIGPLEPQFLAELMQQIDAPESLREGCNDTAQWREQSGRLAALFASRTQAQWCALLEGTDACFAPVLTLEEAARHPHMRERGVYRDIDGALHAAPAPRFSRTPGSITEPIENTGGWD